MSEARRALAHNGAHCRVGAAPMNPATASAAVLAGPAAAMATRAAALAAPASAAAGAVDAGYAQPGARLARP